MPKRRHQTGLSEQTNFSQLIKAQNNGSRVDRLTQNTHHAIATRLGVAHNAGVTRDDKNWVVGVGAYWLGFHTGDVATGVWQRASHDDGTSGIEVQDLGMARTGQGSSDDVGLRW